MRCPPRSLTSIPKGDRDLDLVVTPEAQIEWLADNRPHSLPTRIIDDPALQTKYRHRFDRLLKHWQFGYVNVFRAHVNAGFFLGAQLRDPGGLLECSGKRMRHLKVKPGEELDSAAPTALVDAAYLDVKSRLTS